MKSWLLVLSFFLPAFAAYSQADSTSAIAFTGFVDVYFAYDFNQPDNQERPGFLFNHNRHNEFNVNLAMVKAAYATDRVRSNLGLMAGTYPQDNLAGEQALLKNIYEANAGIRLAQGLWLDAGIFPSHIGLEGPVSINNLTLTRSLSAENSPYYECGVKISYAAGSKWTFAGLVLNGWQNIREPAGNSGKALGTQVQFKPNDVLLLNSSTYVGNDKPDSTRQTRYFHDFYLTLQFHPAWSLAAVFDVGMERKKSASGVDTWYSPALLLHHRFPGKLAAAARAEYYQDKKGVIIPGVHPDGFKTSGYSLNLDYAPTRGVLMRVEGRLLRATEQLMSITASMAVSF